MAKYKRTIYLINPRFQLKFSLFVSTLTFACSLIYPIVIYSSYSNIIDQAKDSSLAELLKEYQSDIIQILILFQFLFFTLVFIICIFQSHKIAGPLHRLKEHLLRIKNKQLHDKLVFRKGDNFQDIAENYNQAIDSINRFTIEQNNEIDNLNKYLEEKMANSNSEQKDIYQNLSDRLLQLKIK